MYEHTKRQRGRPLQTWWLYSSYLRNTFLCIFVLSLIFAFFIFGEYLYFADMVTLFILSQKHLFVYFCTFSNICIFIFVNICISQIWWLYSSYLKNTFLCIFTLSLIFAFLYLVNVQTWWLYSSYFCTFPNICIFIFGECTDMVTLFILFQKHLFVYFCTFFNICIFIFGECTDRVTVFILSQKLHVCVLIVFWLCTYFSPLFSYTSSSTLHPRQ